MAYSNLRLVLVMVFVMAFTGVKADTPSDYNSYCYACIFSGYRYCYDAQTCIALDASCPEYGLNMTSSTGCPTNTTCDFGVSGVGFLGEPDLNATGGYSVNGSAIFTAPNNTPCVAAIVNNN
jgi:hypothetical protein